MTITVVLRVHEALLGKQKSCLTAAGFEHTTFGLLVRRSINWATRSMPEKVRGMGFKYWISKISRFIKSASNCTQFRLRVLISTTYNRVWTEYSSMLTWWNKIVACWLHAMVAFKLRHKLRFLTFNVFI